MKKLYFIFSLMFLCFLRSFAQPAVAPVAPKSRAAANIVSIYGTTYGIRPATNFDPNWGQNGFGNYAQIKVGSDSVLKYGNLNYQGIDFNGGINVSAYDSVHFDIWTPDCSQLNIYLIAPGPGNERFVGTTLTLSGWNNVSIPLSQYVSQGLSMSNIIQFKFVAVTPAAGSTIYLDNIYFWTENAVPTLSNFNVPAGKMNTDAPFTLTPPSSNSNGAFTYTSSNQNVAMISGNTVTIVGAGTSTITATQAASGGYGSGSINAILNVGYVTPTTSAPAPTAAATDVISLLSSTYTNRTVNTWGASWESAVFLDTTIQGNPTKKYSNLNYSGTEFTGANSIDATAMNYFHVDIWTPNSSAVKVKLVDFGADNAYGGGDDKTSIEYVLDAHPTPNTWHSYQVPMSSFTGLDTRAHLSQLLFVGATTIIYTQNIYFSKLSTLPVTVVEFNAVKKGFASSLTWHTSSEFNNKGFYVERSVNGTNWEKLQFISGKGTTTNTTSYEATDNNPLNGINYYRLVQVDADGKENGSSVVSLNFNNVTTAFSVYPNPAKNTMLVSVKSINSSSATLDLVDMEGKIIKNIAFIKQNAVSNISVNIQNISKGIYFLVLKDGSTINTTRVMIN